MSQQQQQQQQQGPMLCLILFVVHCPVVAKKINVAVFVDHRLDMCKLDKLGLQILTTKRSIVKILDPVDYFFYGPSNLFSASLDSWLFNDCRGYSVHGRQQLRSTASGTLLVPRARTATGQRSFAINGPRTWNSLPADLRTPDTTLCSFKRHLKAHLFA